MGDSVQRVRGTVRRAVAAPPVAVASYSAAAGRRLANAVVPLAALAWFPPGVGAAMRGLHAAGRSAFVRRRRSPTLL